jgi:hypothetical protein
MGKTVEEKGARRSGGYLFWKGRLPLSGGEVLPQMP